MSALSSAATDANDDVSPAIVLVHILEVAPSCNGVPIVDLAADAVQARHDYAPPSCE